MNEKDAQLSKNRSRMAFDAQAKTYDTGMKGEHARRLYPYIVREVTRAVTGIAYPRLLDLGCGTGVLAERVIGEVQRFRSGACLPRAAPLSLAMPGSRSQLALS